MFDDPSSGSKTSRYLAFPPSAPTANGASISSDTIAATRPLVSLARTKMSFATTSSGAWRSPWELYVGAGSVALPSAPTRTASAICRQAVATSRTMALNSPEASPWLLSLRGEEPRKCHPLGDHGISPVSCYAAIDSTSSVLRFDIGQIAPCRAASWAIRSACGTRRRTTTQILDGRERETRRARRSRQLSGASRGASISPSVDNIRSAPWKS